MPEEKDGLLPTKEWKRLEFNAPWHQGETLLTGIGQGYVLATPIQLAVMTARIVNGGVAVEPRLTRSISRNPRSKQSDSQQNFEDIDIPNTHLKLVKEAMIATVNSPSGTAFRSRIDSKIGVMGGKTGTVQVRRITKLEREKGVKKNEELPWRDRDHALFVGFAPVEDPTFVVSVIVEHGGSGATKAAPIAKDILVEAQLRKSNLEES